MYEYEIHTPQGQKAYEGFDMVPLTIEHGAERTRILGKPDIDSIKTTYPKVNAQHFIDNTTFEEPKSNDERERFDYKEEMAPDDVDGCRLSEKFLPPGANVCAFGQYDAGRQALVAPVTLRTGSAFAIDAAWRIVNAGLAAVIFSAIALIAGALFCANFPLDAVEQSHPDWELSWWEVDLERVVEKHVRMPLVKAGMLSAPGFYLPEVYEDRAKGRLEVHGKVIELKFALYRGNGVHLSAHPDDKDGVTLVDSKRVILTVDGKSAEVPQSWLLPNDINTSLSETGDYAGRITVIAPDRSIRCRVSFKTDQSPE
ncbi:MAG: hypothetical protein ACLGH0_08530 [Thermoanaerobaculia bacterium]